MNKIMIVFGKTDKNIFVMNTKISISLIIGCISCGSSPQSLSLMDAAPSPYEAGWLSYPEASTSFFDANIPAAPPCSTTPNPPLAVITTTTDDFGFTGKFWENCDSKLLYYTETSICSDASIPATPQPLAPNLNNCIHNNTYSIHNTDNSCVSQIDYFYCDPQDDTMCPILSNTPNCFVDGGTDAGITRQCQSSTDGGIIGNPPSNCVQLNNIWNDQIGGAANYCCQ